MTFHQSLLGIGVLLCWTKAQSVVASGTSIVATSTTSSTTTKKAKTENELIELVQDRKMAQSSCQPCLGSSIVVSSDESCQDLFEETRALPAHTIDCQDAQLRNYQNECCGSSSLSSSSSLEVANSNPCTLCPDGSSFDANKVVPNIFEPNGPATTCADLNIDTSFLDYLFEEGTCSDTLLQRSASWCGCPESRRECYLCPDGSRPPNGRLVDPVYYGWSCDAFDFVSSYFSDSECVDLARNVFEFDAPSYCGCPDSPIPQVCRLCPEGQQIIRPHDILGDGEFTCQQLALSTRYIPSEEPCQRVKKKYYREGYVDYCCGVVGSAPVGKSAYSVTLMGASVLFTMLLAAL